MDLLTLLAALETVVYGPAYIPPPAVGQAVPRDACPEASGNEIVVCKARVSGSPYRYHAMPVYAADAGKDPYRLDLPGNADIKPGASRNARGTPAAGVTLKQPF